MSTPSKKENNGCLWLLLPVVFTVILVVVIAIFTSTFSNLSVIISLLVALFITSKILKNSPKKSIFIYGFIVVVFFLGIKTFGNFLINLLNTNFETSLSFSENENVERTYILENNDSTAVFQSKREWKDNFGNSYEGNLTIRENDFLTLSSAPFSYIHKNRKINYWGGLYNQMENRDSPSLDLIMKTFSDIHAAKKLNQMEFAEMIVTCIQDIPYSFVFQEECQPESYYDESIARVLRSCPECCIGNIPYGVQTPIQFLYNLKGDCDTRTVLIYSILKHFNYDVAILNSDFYLHSIIGLNIPATGEYKIYNGKKYMLWETTAKYYKAGVLPVNFNDVTHWNVVLTSK